MRAVLALVLFCACAPSASQRAYSEHRVPESECRARGPAVLDRAAMERDVRVLARLLERGYAGYGDTEPEIWQRASRQLAANLPPSATTDEFRDAVVDAYRFLEDNHVGFWTFDPEREWVSTGTHETPFAGPIVRRTEGVLTDDAGRVLTECEPALEPHLRVVREASGFVHRPILLSGRPPAPIRCSTPEGPTELELQPLTSFERSAGAPLEREGGRVVLRSLMTSNAGFLERFVAIAPELREEPVVLLDMRAAGGGADRYLVRFFARFTDQRLDYWTTNALTSETTLQGALNFWRCVRASSEGAGPQGRTWLDERIARAESELEQGVERGPFYDLRLQSKHVEPQARGRFEGRLLVATGPGCASACETTVLLARQIPQTWIVGHNTHGTMKVGELRWYRLPESRVWVSLGRRAHIDPQGHFEEARGFLPDIWFDGADAEARLDEIHACAAEPECAARVDALLGR